MMLRPSPSFRSAASRRGMLLIVVLWITMGLVTVALLFGDSMRFEYRAADNMVAGVQAGQAVEGARRYLILALENLETPRQMPEPEEVAVEAVSIGEAFFWLVGRGDANQVLRGSGETPTFGLIDEGSKLNLNTATAEMFEQLPDMTPELAGAIIDWRDGNDETVANGAESAFYMLRTPAHESKNAPFESVDELRLVAGAEWALLVGEDANANGVLDPNEDDGDESWPPDNANGMLEAGLLEYLTVWSREPNQTADGSPRANLREAQALREALIEAGVEESRAGEIVQAVGSQLGQVRSVLELAVLGGMTPEELDLAGDRLTASDEEMLVGLVNASTAPAVVLACLPGIDENLAEQIVSARQGRLPSELAALGWLLQALGEEAATAAGPFLTTRSFVFSADVAAVGREGRGFRRELFVIDTAGDEPVTIYRRDRTRLGWPLGPDALEDARLLAGQMTGGMLTR